MFGPVDALIGAAVLVRERSGGDSLSDLEVIRSPLWPQALREAQACLRAVEAARAAEPRLDLASLRALVEVAARSAPNAPATAPAAPRNPGRAAAALGDAVLAALGQAGGEAWRPISSAPDTPGATILAWTEARGAVTATFHGGAWWTPDDSLVEPAFWRPLTPPRAVRRG